VISMEKKLDLFETRHLPDSRAERTFDTTNTSGQIGAREATIRSLISQSSQRSQPQVDRRRGVRPLLQTNSISSHQGLVERQAWFRAGIRWLFFPKAQEELTRPSRVVAHPCSCGLG